MRFREIVLNCLSQERALLAIAAAFSMLVPTLAAADGSTTPMKAPQTPSGVTTFGGLNWGIGLAADFDVFGNRVVHADIVNNIVRVSDASSNVDIGFVLEAHYFIRDYEWPAANMMKAVTCNLSFCNVAVGVGPFVAIEINGGSSASPAAGGPITGYALGAMVGFHHLKPTTDTKDDNSSWNFGVG